MLSADRVVGFVVASVILVLIPGPMVLFVVGRALAYGRGAAVRSVAGNSIGSAVLVLLVAFGVGSVVQRSALIFMVIKLAGAAYLIYLGIRAYRERGVVAEAMRVAVHTARPPDGGRHVYRQGIVVGLTNPKVLIFFTAFLPQFVSPREGNVPMQMIVLGLGYVLVAMALDLLWGLAAGAVRAWLARSPRRLAALGGAGGLSMIGLGVGLAVTGRRD